MKHLILAALMMIPVYSFAAEGTSVRGGGNSVGKELFDDYEQSGVRELKPKEVLAIVAPIFKQVDKKLASTTKNRWGLGYYSQYSSLDGYGDFLEKLSQGLEGIKWYLDPKPLDQKNECQNQTVLSLKKVVRACQSNLAVRIDRKFFEENKDFQAPLILHELLVYFQLNLYNSQITDEGVREASRALRDANLSNADLADTLQRTGFGSYSPEPTAKEKREAELATKRFNAACARDPQYSCRCPGYQKSGVFIFLLGTVGQSEKDKYCY